MYSNSRPTIMEVDTKAFEYNVNQIQNYIGGNIKIMPVIKANAYGTYINKKIDVINQFEIVAVALVEEAIMLRKIGYEKEIFVLNQPYFDEIENIINYNVTVGISSKEFLTKMLEEYEGEKFKVHLEIETGMGRTGIFPDKLYEFTKRIRNSSNIEVEGIYTHLSSADCDDDFTKKQLTIFKECVEYAKTQFDNLKYIHCSASNGILNYSNEFCNTVRPGILLYGFESYEGAKTKINLKPVCKLKSKITFIKEVPENTSIGYSRKFITKRKSKIATIPIGYADGIRRCLSGGFVVINNKKAQIIGNVCMDSLMIDVTDIADASVGSDVFIWDNETITVDDLAEKYETINYEVISTISDRVPRVFI